MPALIVAASIGVALAFIEVDSSGGKQWLAGWPRLFGVGAEGARDFVHDCHLRLLNWRVISHPVDFNGDHDSAPLSYQPDAVPC